VVLLATERQRDYSAEGLTEWPFMTVKCWGENPIGDWKLVVYDRVGSDKTGTLLSWSLNLYLEQSGSPFPQRDPEEPDYPTSTQAPTTTPISNILKSIPIWIIATTLGGIVGCLIVLVVSYKALKGRANSSSSSPSHEFIPLGTESDEEEIPL